MTKPFEVSPRLEARLAGGLYLLSIVFGMAAILFIRRKMLARGDQATPSRGSPLQRYDLAAIALIMASEQVDFRRLPQSSAWRAAGFRSCHGTTQRILITSCFLACTACSRATSSGDRGFSRKLLAFSWLARVFAG